MRRKPIAVVLVCLVLLLAGGGGGYYWYKFTPNKYNCFLVGEEGRLDAAQLFTTALRSGDRAELDRLEVDPAKSKPVEAALLKEIGETGKLNYQIDTSSADANQVIIRDESGKGKAVLAMSEMTHAPHGTPTNSSACLLRNGIDVAGSLQYTEFFRKNGRL